MDSYSMQRGQEFGQGALGNPGQPQASPGDQEASLKQNMQTPHQWSAHSVLQQIMPSGNGMSQQDASRMLMGSTTNNKIMNPTINGSGQSSYQNSAMLRLQGNDTSYSRLQQ